MINLVVMAVGFFPKQRSLVAKIITTVRAIQTIMFPETTTTTHYTNIVALA
jgi:hypothetical protein